MAQSITITVDSDTDATELLDNFCYRLKYPSIIINPAYDSESPEDPVTNPQTIPNTETKKQFWKRKIIEWTKEIAANGEEMANKVANMNKYNDMLID